MGREISPYVMRRLHGWGPKSRTCGECIFCVTDDPKEESICTHSEILYNPFYVEPEFKACGLFKSQWQRERELLEQAGQQTINFPYGRG